MVRFRLHGGYCKFLWSEYRRGPVRKLNLVRDIFLRCLLRAIDAHSMLSRSFILESKFFILLVITEEKKEGIEKGLGVTYRLTLASTVAP